MTHIPGIHHITAISGPAQPNVDYYVGTLGQRLVKKTVNFDDPGTHHLYYGDRVGSPGTILTFFPFANAGPGRAGAGMASAFAYAVPPAVLDDVAQAQAQAGLPQAPRETRFGAEVLGLRDPDGLVVELVADKDAPDAHGFHSVTLWERDPDPTIRLLTDAFGYEFQGQETVGRFDRYRLAAQGAERGRIIDVVRSHTPVAATPGRGTIHHVAFRARSYAEQEEWIERMRSFGHRTTPVIDRQYFNAIYFREPGGVLFEIATDPPGFSVDEPIESLGAELKLPPQYEKIRDRIEAVLPKLRVPQ